MFGLSEAVAGSFGFGQQHMAYDQQKRMQSRQYGYDKQMAEYAYSKELEQWHRANLYNAPSSQMARLKAAGLNPNLIYGQSSGGAAGQATTLPKYQAPRFPEAGNLQVPGLGAAGAMTMLGQAVNLAVQKRQADKLQADKELVENKSLTEIARLPGIRGRSAVDSALGAYARDYAFSKWKQENSKARTMAMEANLLSDNYESLRKRTAADSRRAAILAEREAEDYRRYRSVGLTSQDAIQWRVAVNLLRAMGVNLSDPNSLFGR